MAKSVRISEVGLRGIVGSGLSAEHVLDFASAFGTFLGPGAVLVGRDPRASSVMLREGVIAGLLACGREVIDLMLSLSRAEKFALVMATHDPEVAHRCHRQLRMEDGVLAEVGNL